MGTYKLPFTKMILKGAFSLSQFHQLRFELCFMQSALLIGVQRRGKLLASWVPLRGGIPHTPLPASAWLDIRELPLKNLNILAPNQNPRSQRASS